MDINQPFFFVKDYERIGFLKMIRPTTLEKALTFCLKTSNKLKTT